MKRTFSLILAAAVCLSLLSGCGPKNSASSSTSSDSTSSSMSSSSSSTSGSQTADDSSADVSQQADDVPSSGKLALSEFSNIEVSALSPDIRLERGEDWSVQYALHSKEVVARAEVADDTFYFSTTFQSDLASSPADCELVITVPAGAEFEDISLSTAAGSIELSELKATELDVKSVSGDVALKHIVSQSLNAESVSGSVTAVGCTAEESELESASGAVHLDGTFGSAELSTISAPCELSAEISKEAKIKTVSGDVKVQAPVTKVEIKTLGSVTVDGKRKSGKELVIGDGSPALFIESVSGKVTVDQNAVPMIQ